MNNEKGEVIGDHTCYEWDFPRIGTCGESFDYFRLVALRTRAIPDLVLKFDGNRGEWVIGATKVDENGDLRFVEVASIHEDQLTAITDDESP